MTQFNLQQALNGKKVVTRTGIEVSKFFVSGGKLYGVVHTPDLPSMRWIAEKFNLDGTKYSGTAHHHDLFMAA